MTMKISQWPRENFCSCKQLLDEVLVISRTTSARLRLITLTEILIILDIIKTESINCVIIHWTKKNESHVFASSQSARTIIWLTSSVSGQDERNLALWLATRARKKELSCPLGIRALPRKENLFMFWCLIPHDKSFIDQACSVKMAGDWLRSFLRVYGSRRSRGP